MFKKIDLNKIKKALRNRKAEYIAYRDLPLEEDTVLLEGGQGSNINGNMFAMLKEICENPRWGSFRPVWVVTEDSIGRAEKRMEFYGFENVVLALRDSDEYCRYLATAKYLMTDNTFPPYFSKRSEQVYLNTWHGTPLKTLGRSNRSSLASLGNVQKNYLSCDYALFPNEFTRQVFMKDYCLGPVFRNHSFIGNYPRNHIFYSEEEGYALRESLGLGDKKVFAYMPTWRGTEDSNQKTKEILDEFDAGLDDSTVLLVNLHFLQASEIDCSGYRHIKYFDSDHETYEILNACDGLITDYSSVFFDFAVTGKKIILFAYDKEEYLSSRGVYMPFDELPFPIVSEVDDVIRLLPQDIPVPEEFLSRFCTDGSAASCEKIFELMVNGRSDFYKLEKNSRSDKKLCFMYAGKLTKKRFTAMKYFIDENPGYEYLVAYRGALSHKNKEAIEALGEDISFYGIMNAFQFGRSEMLMYALCRLFRIVRSGRLKKLFERECRRLFPSLDPDTAVSFEQNNGFIEGVISEFKCEKKAVIYYAMNGYPKYVRKFHLANGFEVIDKREQELQRAISNEDPDQKRSFISSLSKMNNIAPVYYNAGDKMKCISVFSFRTPVDISIRDVKIVVGGKEYSPGFIASEKASKKHRGIYSYSIPVTDVIDLPATTPVYARYHMDGINIDCRSRFFSPLRSGFLAMRGPMNVHKQTDTVAVFRQSAQNYLNIYVRSRNVTDSFYHRIKQTAAFLCSCFWRPSKGGRPVLLFEKNSSKYEESASVLYEKLLDEGYRNAYFIVNKDYEFLDRVPERYRCNLIYKYSFRHYLYFFKSKTFIGTEAMIHSIDLKTFNLLPLCKIGRGKYDHVFLQHGVMYMVSLDSESRRMFRRKVLRGRYRVVVSSPAEADHFVTLGMYKRSDLYITGLPKFDRNRLDSDADRIVIMPTWRPWEINMIRDDFTGSPYYKMLMKLYNSVPDDLKDKIIILPHPLVVNEISKALPEAVDNIAMDVRYDDVLKTARVLITDYSSIAFDAFYRGSRVIFYWEEKDYCMAQYGPSTKLMLNEDNVFGDHFYSEEGLSRAIRKNYDDPQTEEYRARYDKIVSFHDGKNTDRLVRCLKDDGII